MTTRRGPSTRIRPSVTSVGFRRPSQTVQHNGREAKVRGFDQRTGHEAVTGRGRRESSGKRKADGG